MAVVLLTLCVFVLVMTIMAVGVMIKGRFIRSSCGSTIEIGPDGKPRRCESCQCGRAAKARDK